MIFLFISSVFGNSATICTCQEIQCSSYEGIFHPMGPKDVRIQNQPGPDYPESDKELLENICESLVKTFFVIYKC